MFQALLKLSMTFIDLDITEGARLIGAGVATAGVAGAGVGIVLFLVVF